MKISIVTISYNQGEFLRQCINSVLSQEEVDLEYIIVDPGSTDGSREIIQSYGDRVIPIFEQDEGPADGLNKGFMKATGEVFGFINADDFLLPKALKQIMRYFDAHGLHSFISGAGFIENKDGRLRPIMPTKMALTPNIYGACTIFQQGTFFPAHMFRLVGGFNKANRTCWDGELFTDFLAAGFNHETMRVALAIFRLHESSITGSGRHKQISENDRRRIFKKISGREYSLMEFPFSLYWRARKITLMAKELLT